MAVSSVGRIALLFGLPASLPCLVRRTPGTHDHFQKDSRNHADARGRPYPPMSPAEAIGVDLGGTKMLVGVLDDGSEVAWESRERSTGQSEEAADGPARARDRGGARSRAPGSQPSASGSPPRSTTRSGIAVSAVNLPIDNLPIRQLAGKRTGLPIFVDNDANVAALAEHLYGAARGADNAVMLTIGTGIGGGLILGGEIYRGATGAGAELGHMVIAMDGLPLPGQLPRPRLRRDLRLRHGARPRGARGGGARAGLGAGRDARRGPRGRRQGGDRGGAWRRPRPRSASSSSSARRLGVALASLANIFEPDVIVIGGGVIAAGDLLLEPARRELRARALTPMNGTAGARRRARRRTRA